MYVTLKKFGNMHTNNDKNQDMSQIPKININTIMKLTLLDNSKQLISYPQPVTMIPAREYKLNVDSRQ